MLSTLTDRLPKSLESRVWSVAALCAATASFPIVTPYVLTMYAYNRYIASSTKKAPTNERFIKTAIVTGGKMTKSLQIARILKKAGCRVVMVETHKYYMVASRFASCVDRFVTVPVPEQNPEEYLKALKVLAYEEDADLFVPVSAPVASVYDARVARVLPPGCKSLATGEAMTASLDDKVLFAEMAKLAGCTSPDTQRMTSKAAVHAFNDELRAQADPTTYIFKNLQYDSMHRLDLFTLPCAPAKLEAYMVDLEVTPATPWTCQEFLEGQEYSTCAIAHEGHLALFTDNAASISCFNYAHAGLPQLRAWVERFCAFHRITGTVCIDFFVKKDGTPLAIECNPRFSSNITNFYDSPTAGDAFLHPEKLAARGTTETPMPSAKEVCWTATDLYYAMAKPGLTLPQRVAAVAETLLLKKDAYFEPDDVLPFLALHYVHIPTLLMRNIRRGNKWAKIDMCIGKLTEENGD